MLEVFFSGEVNSLNDSLLWEAPIGERHAAISLLISLVPESLDKSETPESFLIWFPWELFLLVWCLLLLEKYLFVDTILSVSFGLSTRFITRSTSNSSVLSDGDSVPEEALVNFLEAFSLRLASLIGTSYWTELWILSKISTSESLKFSLR